MSAVNITDNSGEIVRKHAVLGGVIAPSYTAAWEKRKKCE